MSEFSLEKEFSRMKGLLESFKATARERTDRTIYSKGPYFDFPIFSYQRKRMKRGRIIKNINRIKNYYDVRFYMLDSSRNIIREGWDGVPEKSSYNTFYKYHESGSLFLSYTYGDRNQPLNVTMYEFISGKLICAKKYGVDGVSEDRYFYDLDTLMRIDTCSRAHKSTEVWSMSEHFFYDKNGALESINLIYQSGDSETIYESHEK